MKKMGLVIVGGLLVALSALPFFADGESMPLNAQTRARLPGKFVTLASGVVHYELAGPVEGQVLVLIHGFSAPYFVWDPLFETLGKQGYRVLRYDLYGRGFSDRPDTVYDLVLCRRQLTELLAALKLEEPVDLMALSMGGLVAVDFTNRNPKRVRRMVLLAPAGYPVNVPLIGKIVRLPLIGDYIMRVMGDASIMKAAPKAFFRQGKVPEFQRRMRPQMKYYGFKRAILSSLRNMPLDKLGPVYEELGRKKIPTLLIWGRRDKVVPFANHEKVRRAMPHAQFSPLEDVGHLPSYEKPDSVRPLVLKFLKR